MTGYLVTCSGEIWQLPPLFSWKLERTDGDPCDSAEVSFLYEPQRLDVLKKAVRIQPDLVVKLMLTTEESLRRKPREKEENVQRKHEVIKQLEFPKSRVVVVDVMKDYGKELVEIKNIVWRKLH